ncbi:alpha/beta hydrolase [Nocardia cyriacigeorgica]|uniref:Alpha/beta hydrolase n=1 Tax=Nocardia cyriacigeorgica TaxID=135487 RepID=A0A5R8PHY4_9NOCA|nr:alpha/beta hydrolase [Nocardia cyriacigeorgica]TLG15639.1 alpha/beta hydrolase [Nocardia cyriacigeorgica]
MTRSDVTFASGGETCAGWLYEPHGATSAPGPIIVLAHGLGGVKEMRLDAFAERFAAAGYRCLVFDYRHFGASSGEPRQLLDIGRQLEDWRSAIAYARSLEGVDPERVVIWGTSFGGGHVIRTAARDQRLAAVIAQCPFTDGLASSLAIPPMTSAKVTARALRDRLGTRRDRDPIMVPTYGPPGSTALMTSADSAAGVQAITPHDHGIRSDVAARFALDIIRYFPGRDARRISCPAHFAVCEVDTVAPSRATLRHVAKAPRGEIHLQRGGHFDIYIGEDFESNIAQQLAFLTRHVPVSA